MKNLIKSFLQAFLGYDRYLRKFGWYKVRTLHRDAREQDFFYFMTLIPRDGLVLDIGANLGFLAVHMARRVNKGEVIAFEPMPDNIHAMRYVIERSRLQNIRLETCALGDHDGEVEMILPVEGKARQQGLSHVKHDTIHDHNSGITFKVPLKKLDSLNYLFEGPKKVCGIKMDVENFEQYVLAGATKLLETHHPIIYIELWDNDNRQKCFDITAKFGYHPYFLEKGELVKYDPSKQSDKINFFLISSTTMAT